MAPNPRFDLGQGGRFVDIADHDDRGVVRVIVGVVETAQHRGGHPFDIAAPADGRVVVGVLEKGVGEGRLHEQIHGFVLAGVELVEHHRPLAGEVLVADQRPPHAVGLDGHRHRQLLHRQHLEVGGAVEPGGGVEGGPHPVQGARDLGSPLGVEAFRAFEHQVLEHVRRTGVTGHFVARADPVDHGKTDHRGDRRRSHEHREPVRPMTPLD